MPICTNATCPLAQSKEEQSGKQCRRCRTPFPLSTKKNKTDIVYDFINKHKIITLELITLIIGFLGACLYSIIEPAIQADSNCYKKDNLIKTEDVTSAVNAFLDKNNIEYAYYSDYTQSMEEDDILTKEWKTAKEALSTGINSNMSGKNINTNNKQPLQYLLTAYLIADLYKSRREIKPELGISKDSVNYISAGIGKEDSYSSNLIDKLSTVQSTGDITNIDILFNVIYNWITKGELEKIDNKSFVITIFTDLLADDIESENSVQYVKINQKLNEIDNIAKNKKNVTININIIKFPFSKKLQGDRQKKINTVKMMEDLLKSFSVINIVNVNDIIVPKMKDTNESIKLYLQSLNSINVPIDKVNNNMHLMYSYYDSSDKKYPQIQNNIEVRNNIGLKLVTLEGDNTLTSFEVNCHINKSDIKKMPLNSFIMFQQTSPTNITIEIKEIDAEANKLGISLFQEKEHVNVIFPIECCKTYPSLLKNWWILLIIIAVISLLYIRITHK